MFFKSKWVEMMKIWDLSLYCFLHKFYHSPDLRWLQPPGHDDQIVFIINDDEIATKTRCIINRFIRNPRPFPISFIQPPHVSITFIGLRRSPYLIDPIPGKKLLALPAAISRKKQSESSLISCTYKETSTLMPTTTNRLYLISIKICPSTVITVPSPSTSGAYWIH